MSNLVYTRVSTDEQSTLRQTHLLAEAGLAAGVEGVRMFSDPATSSKIPALTRAGFQELAGYTRPGDTLTVSELYRLCRDLADILAVLSVAAEASSARWICGVAVTCRL
jgi:putative DNA-invertase from lambdoid prophage Rac